MQSALVRTCFPRSSFPTRPVTSRMWGSPWSRASSSSSLRRVSLSVGSPPLASAWISMASIKMSTIIPPTRASVTSSPFVHALHSSRSPRAALSRAAGSPIALLWWRPQYTNAFRPPTDASSRTVSLPRPAWVMSPPRNTPTPGVAVKWQRKLRANDRSTTPATWRSFGRNCDSAAQWGIADAEGSGRSATTFTHDPPSRFPCPAGPPSKDDTLLAAADAFPVMVVGLSW
ncbi:unnamed protein product [Ectocarpus sp. 13 AM-2016]